MTAIGLGCGAAGGNQAMTIPHESLVLMLCSALHWMIA